jgi:hypothetical protein
MFVIDEITTLNMWYILAESKTIIIFVAGGISIEVLYHAEDIRTPAAENKVILRSFSQVCKAIVHPSHRHTTQAEWQAFQQFTCYKD